MFGKATTVGAVLDCSYKPGDSAEWVTQIENVRLPVVTDPRKCGHGTTVCRECAPTWAIDYQFTEPLPWDNPDHTPAPRGGGGSARLLRATGWCAAAVAALYLAGRRTTATTGR